MPFRTRSQVALVPLAEGSIFAPCNRGVLVVAGRVRGEAGHGHCSLLAFGLANGRVGRKDLRPRLCLHLWPLGLSSHPCACKQGNIVAVRSIYSMQPVVRLPRFAAEAAEPRGYTYAYRAGICDQVLHGDEPFGRALYRSLLLAMANVRPWAAIGGRRQPDCRNRARFCEVELRAGGANLGSGVRDGASGVPRATDSGRGNAAWVPIARLARGRFLARRIGRLRTIGNRIDRRIQ